MSRSVAVGAAVGAAVVAALALASPVVGQVAGVPVMVGQGPGSDACGSLGEVVGLNPRGDNFLAVRTGPSTDFAKVDEIVSGQRLYLCETRGRWWGVVYDPSGEGSACGVSSPMPRHAYAGPCRSGWVFDRYVTLIAG